LIWARSIETGGRALLGVEQWAEIRRMKHVDGLSQREIRRRTGIDRDTIRKALASSVPPSYGPRPARALKLDPFLGTIEELLADEPTLSGVRIREDLERLGSDGGKRSSTTCCASYGRVFCRRRAASSAPDTAPASWPSFDLCEPRREVPVGWGQTRRGYVVICELPYSRAFAGALVFSKEFCDIAFGMARCLERLGVLPDKLVWDREGAIAPKGRPTEDFLAFCGQLALGWVILDPRDCQANGALERSHRFLHGNFEAGRRFANQLDFRHRLDGWCERINARVHRTACGRRRAAGRGAAGGIERRDLDTPGRPKSRPASGSVPRLPFLFAAVALTAAERSACRHTTLPATDRRSCAPTVQAVP
jgi:transposase